MKVLVKNLEGCDPRFNLKVGDEIEVFKNSYSDSGVRYKYGYLPIEAIETPIERLERLAKTANMILISVPRKGYTVDVLQTEFYLIVYSHSKGNHWNVWGDHYKFYHDVNTGEYLGLDTAFKDEKIEWKERLLKARAIKIRKIIDERGVRVD